jgi:hypothetical protein
VLAGLGFMERAMFVRAFIYLFGETRVSFFSLRDPVPQQEERAFDGEE